MHTSKQLLSSLHASASQAAGKRPVSAAEAQAKKIKTCVNAKTAKNTGVTEALTESLTEAATEAVTEA